MPRHRIERQISVIEGKGIFDICDICGGEILFYSDNGVKCSKCGQLFGVWYDRKPKIAQELEKEKEEEKAQKAAEEALAEAAPIAA
jgi:Zn-finger nucleic acid-binding protein